jgi:hypothetical protein
MKLLMHIVVRGGAEAAFSEQFDCEVERMRRQAASPVHAVNAMRRVANDPFGPRTPYSGTIEVRGDQSANGMLALIKGFGKRFQRTVHVDLCTALVGEEHIFIPSELAPIRYQYLMRRNAGFTHDAYLRRYREVHSQFGLRTPGIRGYVQFHIDPVASKKAARAAGVGIWVVDSVSELHLDSVEGFLKEVSQVSIGAEAIADEDKFVDRLNSLDFCSLVSWQGG